MAEMKDCRDKMVKICKSSITIQNEEGKTCGVVRGITRFIDLQPNKLFEFSSLLRKLGVYRWVDKTGCVVKGNHLYLLRNIRTKLFREKHGFFSEEEKARQHKKDMAYDQAASAGIEVINCLM